MIDQRCAHERRAAFRLAERAAARISIFFLALALALSLFPTGSALPWGGAHAPVNWCAVNNLPPEMVDEGSGNAFGDMRQYLSDHAFDPDLQEDPDINPLEAQSHWCDIDSKIDEYPPPFTSVPRDYVTYCEVFGRDNGVIQWEGIRDHYDYLVLLMSAHEWAAAYQVAAELGHYVADATCPLHATVNYNGQPGSGNEGIHERYEGTMVDMFITEINTTPNSATIVADPVELGFDILAGGQQLVSAIMAADLVAYDQAGGDYNYDYYQALFGLVGSDAQSRLDLASKRLADLWYTAWVGAGRPSFSPLTPTPTGTPTVTPTPTATLTEPTAAPTYTPTITPVHRPTETPTSIPQSATPTPTGTPVPPAEFMLNDASFLPGEQLVATFTLNEPIEVLFDVYAVLIMPGEKMLNARTLDVPLKPVAVKVNGLTAGFTYQLLLKAIPPGAPNGEYELAVIFFDATKPYRGRQDAFLYVSAMFEIH